MHYLLGGQEYYFPSSNDPSFSLQEFLDNQSQHEYHLPTIVKITSLNLPGRSIKNLLAKNIPLLLLDTYQFESILAEYHRSNDGRYQSNRRRLALTQGKFHSKSNAQFKTMKKLSKSLVTLTTANNPAEETSDEDYDNARAIIRSLNEKRSLSNPLCRVPVNYHGYFELLNENDQAIEPFHQLSDLLIIEYREENHQQKRIEKWPPAFFLRSTCLAYTKRYIPEERKLSGSADSSYGSLSDIDLHRNRLILNDDKQVLQPGQVIQILNPCFAYSSQTVVKEIPAEQFTSQSSTSWIRTKSRFFFLGRKSPKTNSHSQNPTTITRTVYDISKKPQLYLKCRTEQDDIVYISIHESGLFSPINTFHSNFNDSEQLDISGVFQLKELLSNFRFPISVRLLKNPISFPNIYSPARIDQSDSSLYSSTKFRLLLPYTEQVIFACPLIVSSSFKSQVIVIPIPLHSEIEVQRCLNMREIHKNKYFHHLIQTCYHLINQYQTEFSYIHFPLVLNTIPKRKQPLFKKRAQSESHLEYYSSEEKNSRENLSKSNQNELDKQSDFLTDRRRSEQIHHRDSFEALKEKFSSQVHLDLNQRQQTVRRSGYYARLKTDKPKRFSRTQEYDSEDENYRELDHIYDYIRSGDITDDVQRIQAKEQAFNQHKNNNSSSSSAKVNVAAVRHVPKRSERRVLPIDDEPGTIQVHRFPHNLDDSRPLDNDDDDDNEQYFDPEGEIKETLPEPIIVKPITKMKRASK